MPHVSPDLYFPIEIVAREYAGHLLLGTEMAARGRTIVVGHKGAVARIGQSTERRGVVFYKNALMPGWAAGKHELVGMDPEAGIVYRNFEDFLSQRAVFRSESPSRAQFCFGHDDYDLLTEKFPDNQDRLHLTGSPRIELWGDAGNIFFDDVP